MLKPQQELSFSFIRKELEEKYCPDNGRTAEDPEYLFKFIRSLAVAAFGALHSANALLIVEKSKY